MSRSRMSAITDWEMGTQATWRHHTTPLRLVGYTSTPCTRRQAAAWGMARPNCGLGGVRENSASRHLRQQDLRAKAAWAQLHLARPRGEARWCIVPHIRGAGSQDRVPGLGMENILQVPRQAPRAVRQERGATLQPGRGTAFSRRVHSFPLTRCPMPPGRGCYRTEGWGVSARRPAGRSDGLLSLSPVRER